MYNKLRIYFNKNRKYALVRVLSGVISPIIVLTALAGCGENNHTKYKNYDYNNYSFDNNSVKSDEDTYNGNISKNTTSNIELTLDDYSLAIINSKVSFEQNSMDEFTNYVKNINVKYPYSDLYDTRSLLDKYNKLIKYNPSNINYFVNNTISAETLFSIVKENNHNANLSQNAKMSDSNLKEICTIMSNLLNDYAKQNDADLNLLSEKIKNLKILKISEFSNGYYDTTNGKMGFNIANLKSKSNDFFKKTIEHETYHFIQGSSLNEIDKSGIVERYGISYKFLDVDVNSLSWPWYYEGAAEYLTGNRNNTKVNDVYSAQVKSIDTIKSATILSNKTDINEFENLSLSSNMNKLFDYFGCQNLEDKIEILNLMYAYNIKFNMNFSSADFFAKYKSIYGQSLSNIIAKKELNNSIAQTLSKQFYKNLGEVLKEKQVSVKEIFSLISVFENEISREIWYNSNQNTLTGFFEIYDDIQTNFFDIIAKKLGVSTEDIQYSYDSYNKEIIVDGNSISFLNSEKKQFYQYIVETRKNDKMNSINQVKNKNNNNNIKR